MKNISRILLSVVVVLGLVGCSSGSSDKDAKNADGDATTTVAKGTGTDGSPTQGSDEPAAPPSTGSIDREPSPEGTGIIETTEMTSCDTEPGEVHASGTVQLPEGMGPMSVSISVAWVNAETATVFSRSRVQVDDVTADGTSDWSVENILPDNGVPVRCVVGAVALDG